DWHYDYGRTIILDHGEGLSTLYGHASVLLVGAGDVVEAGQTIALVGCTGRCTGSHVHFEVRVNGRAVDPLSPRAIAAARDLAQESSKESRVIAKAQESPRDKAVVRKLVTRTKDTVTTVTDTLQQDRVVRRVEVILVAHGQLRIEIVREFRLVDGVLKLVNERTRIWLVDDDENEDEDEDDEEDD
ncbi:MAG: M23 family metallopeptidase, partial [Armatimonadetes bacterium]|nr:M23 family metallopeptidase [Armatimonadota bacterium]